MDFRDLEDLISGVGDSSLILLLEVARKSAFRTPSRERKRIVESKSSNWIAAVPKT